MWTEKQIRTADYILLVCTSTYLRRVERREVPGKGRGVLWEVNSIYNVLYAEDAEIQKFIPVFFASDDPTCIPLPLRGLTYYQIDHSEGYENLYRHLTNQPRCEIPILGERKALPVIAPKSYPATLASQSGNQIPSGLERRHRQRLLKQVHLDWIEGVLNQSLYKEVPIELGLADRSDFIECPLNKLVRIPDRAPYVVSPGTPIRQIFDEQNGALLILGGPGTGKTTLLLELARDLLLTADKDVEHPIPVVFNLSSWAVRRAPLRDWLITELNERSDVPMKVARKWVENEQILPLLDGLDEVAAEHRKACIEAINNFRREYGLLPIAVCSRIADYQAVGTKLRLHGAVEIQLLSRTQAEEYLKSAGKKLAGLYAAAANDPTLWELLETPLMLWVAMLAYQDIPPDIRPNTNSEERRRQLFTHFVDAMLNRRGINERFSADQTKRWLSSLASIMTKTGQTVVYLEDLDLPWLPTRIQQWLARLTIMVTSGVPGGLLFGVGAGLFAIANSSLRQVGVLRVGMTTGLIAGLACMLFGLASVTILKLEPADEVRFSLAEVSSLGRKATLAGLIFGLILGLIFSSAFMLSKKADPSIGVLIAFLSGETFGLCVRLVSGIVQLKLYKSTLKENCEIAELPQRSVKGAWALALMIGFVSAVPLDILIIIFGGVKELNDRLIIFAFFGAVGAVICMLLKIRPTPQSELRWVDVSSRGREALYIGIACGLMCALVTGGLASFNGSLAASVVLGIISGLIFGIAGGMIRFFTKEAVRETRSAVNEGTWRSMKVAFIFLLILGSMGGLVGWLLRGLMPGNRQSQIVLFFGLNLGLIGGLTSGGMFAIKHFVLRWFLRRNGAAPLKYPEFLVYTKELLFLRQVGGGYIFIHRMLQEYFISLSESESKPAAGQSIDTYSTASGQAN